MKLLHHIPNGGKRDPIEAKHLKSQGVKSGVPDLSLPVARKGYHGLYIEMKVKPNRPTENQKNWLRALRAAGHLTAVAYDWEEAKNLIEDYLKLPPTIPKGESNEAK